MFYERLPEKYLLLLLLLIPLEYIIFFIFPSENILSIFDAADGKQTLRCVNQIHFRIHAFTQICTHSESFAWNCYDFPHEIFPCFDWERKNPTPATDYSRLFSIVRLPQLSSAHCLSFDVSFFIRQTFGISVVQPASQEQARQTIMWDIESCHSLTEKLSSFALKLCTFCNRAAGMLFIISFYFDGLRSDKDGVQSGINNMSLCWCVVESSHSDAGEWRSRRRQDDKMCGGEKVK